MKVILTLAAAAVVLGAPQYDYDYYDDYKNTQHAAPAPAPVVPAEYRQQPTGNRLDLDLDRYTQPAAPAPVVPAEYRQYRQRPLLTEEKVENHQEKRSVSDSRIPYTLEEDWDRYQESYTGNKTAHLNPAH